MKINHSKFFIIPSYKESFFIIPENKGGQEIPNQDKKGLHLSYIDNNQLKITNKKLKFSIQIFSNSKFELVNKMRLKLLNKNNSIFEINDLSILVFESILGNEFFLLYKNFETFLNAKEYCEKYLYFIEKCLIVNTQKLD